MGLHAIEHMRRKRSDARGRELLFEAYQSLQSEPEFEPSTWLE